MTTFAAPATRHLAAINKHLLSFLFLALCAVPLTSTPARAQANTFTSTGSLATGRHDHTATLLPNGKVLVVGGANSSGALATAEVYDPATGTWAATGSLATGRQNHTATLLPNGKVLVVGGHSVLDSRATAELYDPATGTWTPAGSLNTPRTLHTATLLPDGKVLVVGGSDFFPSLTATAELYNPATDTWTPTASLNTARALHTATMLPGGLVLVAGGAGGPGLGSVASAELYNPSFGGSWFATGSMHTARSGQTATLLADGVVLVAGGTGDLANAGNEDVTEIYLPATGLWIVTGSLPVGVNSATATLLPNGKMLVTGGNGIGSAGLFVGNVPSSQTNLYNYATETWSATSSLSAPRTGHTATLLPGGKVLVVGGSSNGETTLATAELYDSANGVWGGTSPLATARGQHTATLLPDGKVLVAGGVDGTRNALVSAELYNPATGTWTATGSLTTARAFHSATLLANGKVLVLGGQDGSGAGSSFIATAELYDPATGTWAATGSLDTARSGHTTTLLANGKVLVAGGNDASVLATSELYDPPTGTWATTGSLATARSGHTATLLPDGTVLVTGGSDLSFGPSFATAELYDPVSGIWTATGSLATPRTRHTATLLPGGKVLVAAGLNGFTFLATAELYNPATGTWAPTGSLATGRIYHNATLLPNGRVLVEGGASPTIQASAEIYDPATGTWVATGSLAAARFSYTAIATLLPNGKVLVPGGSSSSTIVLATAQLYDVGLGFSSSSQPVIGSATFDASGRLVLVGTRFVPKPSASGGNGSQDSATNYPLVQLRRLGSEESAFLPYDPSVNVSATSFRSLPITPFSGYALATVFTNGIPSASVIVTSILPDTTPPDTTITTPANGSFINSTTVTISFSGTDDTTAAGSLTFEGSLDGASFSAVTNPASLTGLSQSSHTYRVRAKDQAANVDPVPASVSFTVDTTAPTISISAPSQSSANSGSTVTYTVTYGDTNFNASTLSAANVTLNKTGSANATSVTVNSGSGSTRTISLNGVTGSGTLGISIAAGTANDKAGNTAPSAGPSSTFSIKNAPVAVDQSVSTNEDTAKSITLTATDADNDALTYTVLSQPAHGTFGGTAPNLTYTPAGNYNGADSFTFKANDGQTDSNVATVSITVVSVNDAPSFTKGGDQAARVGSGPKTVTNWATNIVAGPADEATQRSRSPSRIIIARSFRRSRASAPMAPLPTHRQSSVSRR